MRALIISQPKAGTYLCANLLQEFGIKFAGHHLNQDNYQQYNLGNIHNGLTNPIAYTFAEPICKSIRRINDNYFAVTHLNHTDELFGLFRPFKKIIITRPRHEILESYERFKSIRNGKGVFEFDLKQHYWLDYPNTFHITFTDMIKKNVTVIDELQYFLFGNKIHNSRKCIRNALMNDSLTKSSIR
tara:strand:- start:771 stop:1328 length:558 start_codon:yes stop_codon:yes gene_type:complete